MVKMIIELLMEELPDNCLVLRACLQIMILDFIVVDSS